METDLWLTFFFCFFVCLFFRTILAMETFQRDPLRYGTALVFFSFLFFFVYKRKQLMDIVTIVVDDDVVYLACSGPTLRA